MINYISTRGQAPQLAFAETVLTGLAHDGGLYVPERYPSFSAQELRALRGKSYITIAKFVLWPYLENVIERHVFEKMVEDAYATFRHEAVCPLVQSNSQEFILELFHGPTYAFKDFAMQLLSRLMGYFLQKTKRRTTIIGATSGDTGSAAIAAFHNIPNVDLFILFPKGKISSIQQQQMTCYDQKNIHPLAIDGNFDDCQALVKSIFNDHSFRQDCALSGVNSINWARIMAQIVYYFSSAIALGAPDRAVSFTVPTGNFGDIFAGFVASRMGLPIAKLIIATNENDILTRTFETGRYQIESLIATSSPSMDIQVSSNFERLIFEIHGRDGQITRNLMNNLQQSRQFTLAEDKLTAMKTLFAAGRTTQQEAAQIIADIYEKNEYIIDPHTAVALKVAREQKTAHTPMVVLSTAHPAKFPETIEAACGVKPNTPKALASLLNKKQYFHELPNDEAALKTFIREHINEYKT